MASFALNCMIVCSIARPTNLTFCSLLSLSPDVSQVLWAEISLQFLRPQPAGQVRRLWDCWTASLTPSLPYRASADHGTISLDYVLATHSTTSLIPTAPPPLPTTWHKGTWNSLHHFQSMQKVCKIILWILFFCANYFVTITEITFLFIKQRTIVV